LLTVGAGQGFSAEGGAVHDDELSSQVIFGEEIKDEDEEKTEWEKITYNQRTLYK
jgi:hypothetical protein